MVYEAVCHPSPGGFGEWDWTNREEVLELDEEHATKDTAIHEWELQAQSNDFEVALDEEVNGRLHRQGNGDVYRVKDLLFDHESVVCVWAEEV